MLAEPILGSFGTPYVPVYGDRKYLAKLVHRYTKARWVPDAQLCRIYREFFWCHGRDCRVEEKSHKVVDSLPTMMGLLVNIVHGSALGIKESRLLTSRGPGYRESGWT